VNLEARGGPPFSRFLREGADFDSTPPVLDFNFSGEIPMHINDKAPDFTLQDENGKEIALKDLRGKTVVLYFYPRANTPG
jgi:cytochrome oxidase Cu insertion factor (SCO1/SenC/PrrC family)